MQLHWTPHQEPRARPAAGAARARLGRFLMASTTAHALGVVLAGWLSLSLLPPPPDEALIVRTIDFVEPPATRPAATRGNRREANDAAGGVAAPRATAPPAARASAPAPRVAPPAAAPPAPAPAEPTAPPAPVEPPPPTAEELRLATATPKAIRGAAAQTPASVSTPVGGQDAQPSASPAGAVGGPVATVALPPGLVRGAGSGAGGTGTGTGLGSGAGPGAPGGAGTGAGTGVDLGDPDFSEYFRLIERRVRAAWKFPDSLGGTTQTVKIGFALGPEGSLREARVVSSSSGTLNDSALAAMKRAAPFPPLPAKFRVLAGQPLVMSFTVMIR
jgi:TonB family protein